MSTSETPEQIRAAHLSHEASVKSIGSLYYLSAGVLPLFALASFFNPGPVGPAAWVTAILLLLLAAAYFLLGRWFRALDSRAKTPGTILAAIGLLAFPVGTLINIYILYLINSKKGTVVFSDDYKAVIAATPGMKYKTPLLVWILLGLLILLLVAALVAAFSVK